MLSTMQGNSCLTKKPMGTSKLKSESKLREWQVIASPSPSAMFYHCMKGNLMEREIVLHARGKCESVKQDASVNIHATSLLL